MLEITIPENEFWNEVTEEFISEPSQTIRLEHSLVSISKWESKWHKPFLGGNNLESEELIDYIRCMTISQNVDPSVYSRLTNSLINKIEEYISDPMTATWFSEETKKGNKRSSEIVTSELIYYWMIALQIPMECQKWHLNRLLTLIQVCNIKNTPPKKMSKRELMNRNRALNEARKAALNSGG